MSSHVCIVLTLIFRISYSFSRSIPRPDVDFFVLDNFKASEASHGASTRTDLEYFEDVDNLM